MCSFYVNAGLWEQLINDKYIPKEQRLETPKIETLISLAAKKIFGFEKFRDGQSEAIIAYLNGNDTFVSIKTGGGKTLCYALSAICSEGLTIVFSPLKALMEDQKVITVIIVLYTYIYFILTFYFFLYSGNLLK